MPNESNMFSHREFEELLKKDIENLRLSKDQLPLNRDEFAGALAGVMAHAAGEDGKVMRIELESGRNSAWLPLPATAQELHRTLLDMGALDQPYSIVDCHMRASLPLREMVCGGDINEVNYLAARLAELPPSEVEKLEAVMDSSARYDSIAQIIDYTYNVDRFVHEQNPGVPPEYRIENYLRTAEMTVEQNYNLIDGLINNVVSRRADLTDGQTYEEIVELAPQTLEDKDEDGEEPSILSQLRDSTEEAAHPHRDKERPPNTIDR